MLKFTKKDTPYPRLKEEIEQKRIFFQEDENGIVYTEKEDRTHCGGNKVLTGG